MASIIEIEEKIDAADQALREILKVRTVDAVEREALQKARDLIQQALTIILVLC